MKSSGSTKFLKWWGCLVASSLVGFATTSYGGTLTVKFGSAMEVIEGGVTNTYAQNATFTPTAIPCIYMMRPANMAEGERTFCIKGTDYAQSTNPCWRFPQYGEGNWVRVALDPVTNATITLTGYKVAEVLYADADHGDDDWDGTTDYEHRDESNGHGPKQTLQAANDAITSEYTIVLVAPGIYNKGGAMTYSDKDHYLDGSTNPYKRRLATRKNHVAFIATEGAERTFIVGERDSETESGAGANAVGGVYMQASASSKCQYLQGFTITGCYSTEKAEAVNDSGAAFCSGACRSYCLDCVISNNYANKYVVSYYGIIQRTRILENYAGQYPTRSSYFVSCLFAGNRIGLSDSTGFTRALHSGGITYFCTYDLRNKDQPNGRKRVEGETTYLRTALVYGLTEKSETTTNAAHWCDSKALDAPLFANADARDYRLRIKSPARDSSSYENDLNDFARRLMTSDVDGRMPVLHDGKLSLGAVWNEPQVWYVAQDGGNDANDGTSPETAKATINAAIAHSFSGDTIRVAPGMYGAEEGDRRTTGAANAGFRVIVPEDVTLESTDGAEKTFIVGADAPTENIDNETYKTGEGGVRCVYGRNGATVRGFTLTGGRGVGVNSGSNTGAGFYSTAALGATVEDCIISNNAAYNHTIYQAVVKRCRVFENVAIVDVKSGAAGSACSWYGSIIDKNKGNGTIYNAVAIENCTIGANNAQLASVNPMVVDMRAGSVVINNSVILGGRQYGADDSKISCSNSLITGSGVTSWSAVPEEKRYNTEISTTVKASVDSAYRPIFGSFAGIDMSGAAYSDALGDKDIYGAPRVMNGAIDVGAVEYDWRPTFAQALGRQFTMTYVSPSVTTNATGGLVVSNGEVAGTVGLDGDYELALTMTGGNLAVYVGGAVVASATAGATSVKFSVPDTTTGVRIVFTPDAENPGSAVLKKLASTRGLVLIYR